jgi:hypothetical protein
MLNGTQLYKKLGHPDIVVKQLVVWDVPPELEIGNLPDKVYCHPLLIPALKAGFKNVVDRGLVNEIKTWDGCWNNRVIRGYENKYIELMKSGKTEEAIRLKSIHSWACAFDINAAENGLGVEPKLSRALVKCFTDAGFDWGGNFKRKDGMHFQLANI